MPIVFSKTVTRVFPVESNSDSELISSFPKSPMCAAGLHMAEPARLPGLNSHTTTHTHASGYALVSTELKARHRK